MTTYGITGASGKLGRLATDRLLAQVDAADVVLLTRHPDELTELASRGVTVRAADFYEPTGLAESFASIDRLLLVSLDQLGTRVAAQNVAIDAARAAGVQRVIYTSLPRPEIDNPVALAQDHRLTEEHLQASGLEWVSLRNNLYADMQLDALRQAAEHGALVTNAGAGLTALVTREDCAAAAVGALVGDDVQGAYDITGPQALSSQQLAEVASRFAGRPIEVVDLDDDKYERTLVEAGLPAELAQVITSFGRATREGWLADVSPAVRDLTGREPAALTSLL